jgi:hypothetical protein
MRTTTAQTQRVPPLTAGAGRADPIGALGAGAQRLDPARSSAELAPVEDGGMA